MGFFRKLFRTNDSEDPSADSSPASATGERVTAPLSAAHLDMQEAPAAEDSATDVTQLVTEDIDADEDSSPWWASSAPPTDAALSLRSERGTLPLSEYVPPERAPLVLRTSVPATAPLIFSSEDVDDAPTVNAVPLPPPRAEHNEASLLEAAHIAPVIRSTSTQGLAAAALRDVGRVRQINQDSVIALLTTLPRDATDMPLGLFVVADGMGGHDNGEVASRLAITNVAHTILEQIVLPALQDAPIEALQSVVSEAVQNANRAIWDHAQQVGSDMGTTCTTVLMLGAALYIGHVGDSRAYILDTNGLRQLTNDHSAVGRLIQLGQLDPSEAREHPMRSQLYRTVGQQPQVLVDFVHQPIGASTHLLLASDGLWSLVNENEMAAAIRAYVWPQDACRELVALANEAGGDDNISAVVVSFQTAERAAA